MPANSSWATSTRQAPLLRAPQPDVLCRNGTYVVIRNVIRNLHSKVALWRHYLHASASLPADEELLAAKLVGRCPSGALRVLSSKRDGDALCTDHSRNHDFLYADADRGFHVPGRYARSLSEPT